MFDTYYLGAYWGNRRESASQCAERMHMLLNSLAGVDEAFAKWFQLGRSRKDALSRQFRLEREAIRELLERGRNRRDVERTVIEELGFQIALWNGGRDDQAISLKLACGGYASSAKVWIPNSFVIDLPKQPPSSERVLRIEVLMVLVESVARALEPDWVVVNSYDYLRLAPARAPGVPVISWITYFGPKYGRVPRLPPPSHVADVDGRPSLVIVTDERFTASNPDHLTLTERISKVLDKAGLLRRVD